MDSAYRSYNFPFGLCLSIVIRTLNGNGNSPLDSSLTMRSRTRFENNNNFPFGLCLSIVPKSNDVIRE